MAAGKYNITIEQGSTWSKSITVSDKSGATKTARNLTGYSARMKIKDRYTGSAIGSYTSTPAAGIVITAATGVITLTITATQTAAFTEATLDNRVYG
jgi:endoglucanase Acf2